MLVGAFNSLDTFLVSGLSIIPSISFRLPDYAQRPTASASPSGGHDPRRRIVRLAPGNGGRGQVPSSAKLKGLKLLDAVCVCVNLCNYKTFCFSSTFKSQGDAPHLKRGHLTKRLFRLC